MARLAPSLSTTCEPMNPDPPVTRTLNRRPPGARAGGGPVVQRRAPVVLRDPVGVREIDGVPEHAVAGLVVDLPGGALERLEDDVLVEARDHPVGKLDPRLVTGSSSFARDAVLPRDDLLEPLGADDPERGRELVHSVVEPGRVVVGLAVVAERARELDQVVVAARRAGRPRRSRSSSSARTTRCPRRRRCPACGRSTRRRGRGRSPRAGRSPPRGRARRCARCRTRCGRRCGRPSPRAGLCSATFRSKSSNDMQRSFRLQSTNSTSRRRRASRAARP